MFAKSTRVKKPVWKNPCVCEINGRDLWLITESLLNGWYGFDFILRTEFRIETVHAWFKLRMVIFWFELFEGVSLVDVYVNFGTPIRVCQILVFLLFNFRADFIVDRIFYRWWDCAFLLFSRVARSNLRHEKMTRRQKSSHNCLETSVIVWKWYEVKIFKMSI